MLAVEVEIDGINYELNSETKQATVIAKSSGKYSGNIVVPKSIEFRDTANVSVTSFSVTSIGERAFYACGGLSSVAIGNGVTSIGNDAFFGCSNLTSVTIGNVVRSIGSKAFYECASLTSITIPKSVVSIGDEAFYACNGLSSVHISDIAAWCKIEFGELANPLFNAHHLYMNGEEIKELVIPDNVTSIGNQAFFRCSGLISVTIPNSVTNMGWSAFYGCGGLTSVIIGNGVTNIGGYAFSGCRSLTSVTIPNSVVSIEYGTFENCI